MTRIGVIAPHTSALITSPIAIFKGHPAKAGTVSRVAPEAREGHVTIGGNLRFRSGALRHSILLGARGVKHTESRRRGFSGVWFCARAWWIEWC